jgi:hypothetical protein
VAPGEEDENQLVQHVGVGDVEVMLKGGDGNIAIKLLFGQICTPKNESE